MTAASGVFIQPGSIASVRLGARRVRSTSISGRAGGPSPHPRLGRLRRIDDVGDGSASRCLATAMALGSLKNLGVSVGSAIRRVERDGKIAQPNQPHATDRRRRFYLAVRWSAGLRPPCRAVRHAKTPDNLRNSPLGRSGDKQTVGLQCCARWTCASRVRPLQIFCTRFARGSVGRRTVELPPFRCKECARPAALTIGRCVCRHIWSVVERVVDPPSVKSNWCPPAC
jgi:hypothetical protein